MRGQVAEGLHYVLRHPYLRNIAACTGWSNLFSNVAFATFLVYLVRDLGLEPAEIGIAVGVGNIGFLAGAVLSGRVARVLGVGRTILVSAFAGGLGVLIIALTPAALAIPGIILGSAVMDF